MLSVGSSCPDQRLKSNLRQWKHRVLTTRLPGNSHPFVYFQGYFPCLRKHMQKDITKSNIKGHIACFLPGLLWFQVFKFFFFLNPFWVDFVYGVRWWSSFILFYVTVQFYQHHWRDLLFSIVWSWLICHKLK